MNELRALFKKPAVIVLAVLTAIGFCVWVYQLIAGLGITGLNNSTSWGLYLVLFMFFEGLAGGGLILASAVSIFHLEKFKGVVLPAVICSLACICCAGLCVLIDLGSIQNIWLMVIGLNVRSPLAWDMIVITCYLVINLLYLFYLCSKKADPKKVAIVSRIALPIAILTISVSSWIFGLEIAREAWNAAIMAPIFVASALDSGIALLIIVLMILSKKGMFDTPKSLITGLAGLLCTCIAIDFYFIFCEILTVAYNGTDAGNLMLSTLLAGGTAPFFWFEIVCGLIIPFLVLVFARNRENMTLVTVASVLTILGVFCKRCWLMFTGFANPNIIGGPGISGAVLDGSGATTWSVLGYYMPTVPEVALSVGIFTLGALMIIVLTTLLVKREASGAEASQSEGK